MVFMKKRVLTKASKKKKAQVKPSIDRPFYRTKQYFVFANNLISIVQGTFPEGVRFTKKEKIERVNWRKELLEQELKRIETADISRAEKDDLKQRYTNWIDTYNKMYERIKEGK